MMDSNFTALLAPDKSEIIQVVALHHVILRSKAELDQFSDGLALCGVLQAIKCHSSLTRSFLLL